MKSKMKFVVVCALGLFLVGTVCCNEASAQWGRFSNVYSYGDPCCPPAYGLPGRPVARVFHFLFPCYGYYQWNCWQPGGYHGFCYDECCLRDNTFGVPSNGFYSEFGNEGRNSVVSPSQTSPVQTLPFQTLSSQVSPTLAPSPNSQKSGTKFPSTSTFPSTTSPGSSSFNRTPSAATTSVITSEPPSSEVDPASTAPAIPPSESDWASPASPPPPTPPTQRGEGGGGYDPASPPVGPPGSGTDFLPPPVQPGTSGTSNSSSSSSTTGSTGLVTTSSYPANSNSTNLGSGTISITVPAHAKVYINGYETKQTGTNRTFVSNGLIPGQDYQYEVRVVANINGRVVEETKYMLLTADEHSLLAFSSFGQETRTPSIQLAVRP